MGDWGVGDSGTVPDMVALLTPFSLTGAFDDFNPVGAPTGGWKGNANDLLWADGPWIDWRRYTNWTEVLRAGWPVALQPGLQYSTAPLTKTRIAVYAQVALKFDIG